jgi:hypothetical protein
METALLNETFAGRHSMDTPEWYTPAPFVEAAREVMGAIDLDPASHEEANVTVKATKFYSEQDNGLIQPWRGRVFVNPPGGLVVEFWRKLLVEALEGRCSEAIWIGYSLEQLQTLQTVRPDYTPLDFTFCVTKRRIAFVENEAKREARLAKIRAENEKRRATGRKLMSENSGPSHGNYIAYVGDFGRRFAAEFAKFGQVVIR